MNESLDNFGSIAVIIIICAVFMALAIPYGEQLMNTAMNLIFK